jgi:hypothetical protein
VFKPPTPAFFVRERFQPKSVDSGSRRLDRFGLALRPLDEGRRERLSGPMNKDGRRRSSFRRRVTKVNIERKRAQRLLQTLARGSEWRVKPNEAKDNQAP